MKSSAKRKSAGILAVLLWTSVLAFFFAEVEIQVEGPHGWAANMPTWRIEKHWLLEILWGGRPLTGYHAWVFSFMFLAFHLPLAVFRRFSLRLEARCLGSLMLFWIIEDFLWFALNPSFGLSRFTPQAAPWHIHWFCGVPLDYPVFSIIGSILVFFSFSKRGHRRREPRDRRSGQPAPPGTG